MTADDVKAIREALGRTLGRRISQNDLGLALGLAPANAADTVRSWEDGKRDVSGPATLALQFMREATDQGIMRSPEFVSTMKRMVVDVFASSRHRNAVAD